MRARYPTWLVALAAIGVVAAVSVALDLIAGVGRRTAIVTITQAPAAANGCT